MPNDWDTVPPPPDRDQQQGQRAELKAIMEALWKSPRIVNPCRKSRYVAPMSHGSTWGYENEIFGE